MHSRAIGAAIHIIGKLGSSLPSKSKTTRLAARRSGMVARSGSVACSRMSKETVKLEHGTLKPHS